MPRCETWLHTALPLTLNATVAIPRKLLNKAQLGMKLVCLTRTFAELLNHLRGELLFLLSCGAWRVGQSSLRRLSGSGAGRGNTSQSALLGNCHCSRRRTVFLSAVHPNYAGNKYFPTDIVPLLFEDCVVHRSLPGDGRGLNSQAMMTRLDSLHWMSESLRRLLAQGRRSGFITQHRLR